ncbi:hypothetical protein RclHR1_15890001 [Rhizophagus clarus]|uniref:Uncharacterized protein n=1 Tax=Rhizophagus clarus TaxID=94130 RepID=A0A2Z6QKC0_9GLOM|nr:hypothetical protein RclHR1_15890001 [Rhizophagus clarus]
MEILFFFESEKAMIDAMMKEIGKGDSWVFKTINKVSEMTKSSAEGPGCYSTYTSRTDHTNIACAQEIFQFISSLTDYSGMKTNEAVLPSSDRRMLIKDKRHSQIMTKTPAGMSIGEIKAKIPIKSKKKS